MDAHAELTGKAQAAAQYESNSNVFDLNSGYTQPGIDQSRRSDTLLSYAALFNVDYSWSRQDFYASASTTKYDYQHFSQLDHDEYKFDGGMNWKFGPIVAGKLDVTRNHTMVPFFDLNGTTLSLQTEQRELAEIGLTMTRRWRIEASGYHTTLDEPLPQAPELRLTESSGTAALNYLGTTGFTTGVYTSYASGHFDGTGSTLNPSYHETSEGLQTKLQLARSSLEGNVGYSRRSSITGTDDSSGFTGNVTAKYQLTPKTSIGATFVRAINSFLLNAGSEIDTSTGVAIDWRATYKTAVSLGYTFTYREFPGQGNNPVGSLRADIQQYASFGINYQPARWLVIKPYANVQTRHSNYLGGDFSATVFGVYVTLTTPSSK